MFTNNPQEWENQKRHLNLSAVDFGSTEDNTEILNEYISIYTNNKIIQLTDYTSGTNKRWIYNQVLSDFIGENDNVIAVNGLRRTGKTHLLHQIARYLQTTKEFKDKVAYIELLDKDKCYITEIIESINSLIDEGIQYIIIDEITLLIDFNNTCHILADAFTKCKRCHLLIAGTDSLQISRASSDGLFDRIQIYNTMPILYKEFKYLKPTSTFIDYMKLGGVLSSFSNQEKSSIAIKYLDSAVCDNIANCISQYKQYHPLKMIHMNGLLTPLIKLIIENIESNKVLLKTTYDEELRDLIKTKPNMKGLADILYKNRSISDDFFNYHFKLSEHKEILLKDFIQKNQIKLEEIKMLILECLEELNIIIKIPHIGLRNKELICYVSQIPLIRYLIYSATSYGLQFDLPLPQQEYIEQLALEHTEGRVLEDIIDYNTYHTTHNQPYKYLYKYTSSKGLEIDLIIYDFLQSTLHLYEVKHTSNICDYQTKHLNNPEILEDIKNILGITDPNIIVNKHVLYLGETKQVQDIKYLNVEDYLLNL